ncbi:Fatty acid hydroxylase superfamily protein [Sinomicrobium oceani]|uniref:Fatty acid hydroxylase superfamily protein n=1 Tax=Sinomicrobium oceani TaxID=1150368 RepID=A0A1K1LPP7_9FLAO|nr:sterol desaturase family protein [Sinomicrobium oceani]SFW12827.1 Fatty acid hydroxylase superfamily protein [Sinomicrobium oceani]
MLAYSLKILVFWDSLLKGDTVFLYRMPEKIIIWSFETWYHTVISMFLFFNLLYWGSALGGQLLLKFFHRKSVISTIDNDNIRPGQVKREISKSMMSIAVFSLQGIIFQQGIQHGWLHISYSFNWICLIEIPVLFFWNEIHFYLCHVLMHRKWFMRHVHTEHHRSKEPTVFSTYSFHWFEAFLLGTVIIPPLLFYPFHVLSVLSLPVMSILINMLGHSNYEFHGSRNPGHLLKFSYRHSMHHKTAKGNFGFMLPWFDQLFNTTYKTKEK